MKVKDIMTSNVRSMANNTSIKDVAKQMEVLNVGSIPITDREGRPIGIVTDRDIAIRGMSSQTDYNNCISNVMSSNLMAVTPDTDIHEAARIMSKNQIRRLPVVENDRLVGIVSIGDLAVRDVYANEAGNALSNISRPTKSMR